MKRKLPETFLNEVEISLGLEGCTPRIHDCEGALKGRMPSGRRVALTYKNGTICTAYIERFDDDPYSEDQIEDCINLRKVVHQLLGVLPVDGIPNIQNDDVKKIVGESYVVIVWINVYPESVEWLLR